MVYNGCESQPLGPVVHSGRFLSINCSIQDYTGQYCGSSAILEQTACIKGTVDAKAWPVLNIGMIQLSSWLKFAEWFMY